MSDTRTASRNRDGSDAEAAFEGSERRLGIKTYTAIWFPNLTVEDTA